MAQRTRLLLLSADEYLEGELHSPVRHEYVAGRVFAMTGTSRAHNLIAGNFYAALRAHLRGGSCRAFMFDLKVRVQKTNAFYSPDIAVTCHAADTQTHYLTHPCLVIEVLCPTTEGIDLKHRHSRARLQHSRAGETYYVRDVHETPGSLSDGQSTQWHALRWCHQRFNQKSLAA